MKFKKNLFLFLFLLFALILLLKTGFVFAFEIEDYPPVLGVTMPANPGFPDYARYFFNLGMVVAVSLAALVIIIGGIYWIVSVGSGKITHEGKEWVIAGIKGLVLLLCSYLIAVTINPALVHPKLEGLIPIFPWPITPTTPIEPIIPTITYQEIPIGTLTENVLARAIPCYDFDENGNPIDGDSSTLDILEPTLLNHDRIDCILKLAEAVETKAEKFKKLSEQLVELMEKCKCKSLSATGNITCPSENDSVNEIFSKKYENSFTSKIRGVLLASVLGGGDDGDFETEPYKSPEGEVLPASNITATSATLRGKITDDGGGPCWYRFKWREAGGEWQEGQWRGSFTTGMNFSETISGLEPNTNYEFTAEIRNADFNSGNISSKTFRTLPLTKPSAELLDASNITATSATLRGKVTNDGGDACKYQFKWRKIGETQWTLIPAQFTGSLRTGNTFSQNLSSLEPNTTYEFTAEVKNAAGTTLLTVKRFTTKSVTKPSAELLDASNITATSATLRGKVTNDGGDACKYQFKWRKIGETQWTLIPAQFTGSLRTGNTFSQNLSSLEPNTTYEFTAEVKNAAGSTGELSPIKTFTTKVAGEPAGELYAASNITATSATLGGKILDDGGDGCYFQFKWRKQGISTWTLGEWKGGSYTTNSSFSQNITGLTPNTTYEFTVEIKNQTGKTSGNLPSNTFKTLSVTKPSAELLDASNITATSATLRGKVTNDGGDACKYQFKWRKIGETQWTLIPAQFTGSLRTGNTFSQNLSSLEPNTTYEFTAEVKNAAGSTGELSPIKTFTTKSDLLSCNVYGAGSITASSATLTGKVIADGGEVCQYQFKWKKEGEADWTNASGWRGSLRTNSPFNYNLSGLNPQTRYGYMAEIKNSKGTVQCDFKRIGPPLGLKAVALNTTQVYVSWVKDSEAETTMVRRGDGGNCPLTPIAGTLVYSGPVESFVNTGLTPDSVYCYVAWSVIGQIYSDPSNPAYVTTEKESSCTTTRCPGCSWGWTQEGPCPDTNPCPKECPSCGCPPQPPDCVLCPPGIKILVENGPIVVDGQTYQGLDEFRTEYPNTSDEDLINKIVEKEETIDDKKIKVIQMDVWNNLRLVDRLRYLKEKIKEMNLENDLNLLKEAENKLGECYLAKTYVDFLKIVESARKEELLIDKEKPFIDPFTNEGVDISRYCKGFNWNESQCFNNCRNIYPGISPESHQCFKNTPKENINGLNECFNYPQFKQCLIDCRNNCLQKCQQRYPSQQGSAYQECIDKCNNDSKCFLNYTAQGNQTGGNVLIKDNVEKCYSNLLGFKDCADRYKDDFFGFKNCAEMAFRCKYVSDQQAGYPECSKRKEYSSLFLYQNPNYQKNPYCFIKKTNGIIYDGVEQYPELWKCPSCSDCPKCPCLNQNCTQIEESCLISSGECGEFAYNDDPLTFYCRKKWTLEIPPTGRGWTCSKADEIPVGQTVDDAEKWAEELSKLIRNFIEKTQDMINYNIDIGKETGYCKCNSLCQAGERACNSDCEYKKEEVEYEDPETGEILHYWVCYCAQYPCDGNPCQKMINLLRGKSATDKCPKGEEYKGVAWYYEQIKTALEELKGFAIVNRSEILKRLIYSRKKMNEGSALIAEFGPQVKELLSCRSAYLGTYILKKRCYGALEGLVRNPPEILLDNWFFCSILVR